RRHRRQQARARGRGGCRPGGRHARPRRRLRRGPAMTAAASRRPIVRSADRPDNLRRAMGLVLTATFAACLWVTLTALGGKSLDALLLALVIVLVAAGTRLLGGALPGLRHDD